MTEQPNKSKETVSVAAKIREAMIECVEERDGRYYATEAGCKKLRGILAMHGIEATVTVGADGRFEVGPIEPIRRKHPFTVQCSSCGADIVWFRTKAGRRMPVDESSTQPTDREDQLDLKRHISHFATCPDAAKHRRPR